VMEARCGKRGPTFDSDFATRPGSV